MRSRMIIVAIAATLALAGSSIAVGNTAERRVAAPPDTHAVQQLPKSLTKVQRALAETARVRIRCGSIQCVNGALTGLAKAFRTLSGCMSYINIARYPGYVYSNDGGATTFTTTGFDEAEPGEPATKMAILTC
jgi:hypothetical protein